MNILKSFLMLAAPVALLASCNKVEIAGSYEPADVILKASVGVLTKSNPLGDAEAQAKFNAGDKIKIQNISANQSAVYRLESDGSWTPEDTRLVWLSGENYFSAEFPAGYRFCTDQSDEAGLSASDKMEIVPNNVDDFIATDDGSHVLSLQMRRCNALVTFKIAKYNDQFSADEAGITDFKAYFKDGSDNIVEVTPYIRDAQGVHKPKGTAGKLGYSYSAIMEINDSPAAAEDFVKLDVKVGSEVTSLNVTGIPVFEAGKAYVYNLTVGKDKIAVDGVTVKDWTSVDLGGGNDEYEAVFDGDVWDGTVATGFASGSGAETDPYIISTGAQLAFLAEQVNSGAGSSSAYKSAHYGLGANIDLKNRAWTPIGYHDIQADGTSMGQSFGGTFNGNGYSIVNLNVDATGTPNRTAGFFGAASGCTMKNIKIINADVKGTIDAGILVGYMPGSSSANKIEHCAVSGTVSGTQNCGGLIGDANYGDIEYCNTQVSVSGSNGRTGGLVGNAFESKLVACFASGSASGTWCVGGIAGVLFCNCEVYSCHPYVDVTASDWRCGGFAGYTEDKITIKDCIVYGKAKTTLSSNCKLGGFIGEIFSSTTITGCGFCGTIDAPAKADGVYVGAFIGYDTKEGKTVDCHYKSDPTVDGYDAVGYIADETTSSHDIRKVD